jgi:hypothetical protein
LIFTYPRTPKVDGNIYAKYFQNGGKWVSGHVQPLKKTRITLKNRKETSTVYLFLMKILAVIEKNIVAKRKGNSKLYTSQTLPI